MTKKVISLWSYGEHLPSFRHRLQSLIPLLEKKGWTVETVHVPAKRYFRRIIERLDTVRRSDLMVLSKLKLNPLEMLILRRYGNKIIFDFDDAIYLRRPKSIGQSPGRSKWRTMKFMAMCRHADLVFAGNTHIAAMASNSGTEVAIIPTPVDAALYSNVASKPKSGATIVWIGLPGNLIYLDMVHQALKRLRHKHPELTLRIVSAKAPEWTDIPIEFIPWSSDSEADSLKSADIGIMPLFDDEWSRGKCAFKLLQYMAAGLPCIASPVGANTEVVLHGKTGYHASTSIEWETHLDSLLSSTQIRLEFGKNGRQLIESAYDRAVVGEKALNHINRIVNH